MHKLINGKRVEMTDAEITAHNEDIKNVNEEMKIIFDNEIATATKKASGKQKLKDLGLDDDEIKALIGV